MADLFKAMDESSTAISPIMFLHVLHSAFPKFAEKGEQGGFMQQVSYFIFQLGSFFSFSHPFYCDNWDTMYFCQKKRDN